MTAGGGGKHDGEGVASKEDGRGGEARRTAGGSVVGGIFMGSKSSPVLSLFLVLFKVI